MLFKNKRSGTGSRTRSCSGPSSIRKIGSEDVVQPHMLTVSIPSALSNTDPTSIETISSDDNAIAKCKKTSKSHFLRQPRKSTPQGRTLQKIKNWKDGRNGSISSNEDLHRGAGKNFKWIFGENRKFRGRSYSSATMLSQPIHDLQMFGSVPPTPTLNEDSHRLKFSSNESSMEFRNKSATLPNNTGLSFASIFERMTLNKNLETSGADDSWPNKSSYPNSINSAVDCPCSSCREKRWLGSVGNNYQFPTRSQSDWIAIEKMRKKAGFYYNSNPAEFEIEPSEVPANLRQTMRQCQHGQHSHRNTSLSGCVYANLSAIQDANEILKSEAVQNVEGICFGGSSQLIESNCLSYDKRAPSNNSNADFHSLPKNFLKTFYHPRDKQRTFSDSEQNRAAATNILCPCCGNVFYYNVPNKTHSPRFGIHGMTHSEPTTPIGHPSDNSLQEFSRGNKFLSFIPSPRVVSGGIPDYLKPDNSRHTEGRDTEVNCKASSPLHCSNGRGPMTEFQMLYLVPPPQCHSTEALRSHTYENGEYWKKRNQSNGIDSQMNYITYVRSESSGLSQSESLKTICADDEQNRDSETSSDDLPKSSNNQNQVGEDLNVGVDVAKYEIKPTQASQAVSSRAGPNIYLRPRPLDTSANFPYVWLLSSNNEIDDGSKCSKFGNVNKMCHSGRLPPLKENVAFFI